jgi:hypothetical protein
MMAGKGRERRNCLSCGEGFKTFSPEVASQSPREKGRVEEGRETNSFFLAKGGGGKPTYTVHKQHISRFLLHDFAGQQSGNCPFQDLVPDCNPGRLCVLIT